MMNNDVNIFDIAKPQGGEFFKFQNIGDQVQGTYIDSRSAINMYGNQQIIYVLVDKNNKVWNCGFVMTNSVIHNEMSKYKYGTIVGFRYDADVPSKKKPGTMAHAINVYADPKVVDHEWLKQQADREAQYGTPSTTSVPTETSDNNLAAFSRDNGFSVPDDASPTPTNMPTAAVEEPATGNEALEAVRTLARTKGLTNAAMTPAEADAAIEAYTELPLVEENLVKTIVKLTSFAGK